MAASPPSWSDMQPARDCTLLSFCFLLLREKVKSLACTVV